MEDGRGSSGIGSGKSIGLAEGILLPAEAVESNRSRPWTGISRGGSKRWTFQKRWTFSDNRDFTVCIIRCVYRAELILGTFVRRNLYSCPQHIKKSAYTTLVRPLLEYSSSVWDPHTKTLVNKIEMVQRRAARFCHNDYKTIEKGCVSEMIRKLNLEPLNIRRTNKRLTIFHKAINGHLALPIGHLQPVLRRTRHLNSKAYNTIHTSKDCYKYSFFPRTIKDWNSLPDKIATIKEPHKFKFALAHFD